jgi:tRNA A-37 threonylcarbamoyl transferase component Bud32
METMDTTGFEQQIVKLGLVTEAQLACVHDEVGKTPDLAHLIAILERKSYLTPWQRGKVLKGDWDGFFLGGYRILYKIQSGSFGRVYRADDPRSGNVVAVKVLRRRWSEDQARIDQFIREGKVGLSLKHPNIVEVLAINRDASSGQYYLVMEFVEGGNLREILQIRKKLTVVESLRIVEDATNGLAYAYARGMTHRDIKLTNLLISSQGEAKLVDFGLAQFFASFAKEEEKVDRTVDYAGLEKATGVKMGDVRSDLYFLGTVLYESLTGRSPLVMTRDRHARMRKERFEEVRAIHPSEVTGPPSVLSLVETMMSLDPRQRYQTPSQLLEAIKAVRREAENKSGRDCARRTARSVFLAEHNEHLQEVLRDGLKEKGYRVFLAGDPARALDRFHQHPYEGLIVDATTTGEEGLVIFSHIVEEADRKGLPLAAILILGEEQATWEARVPQVGQTGVLIHPVKFKPLVRKLKELMEAAHGPEVVAPSVPEEEPSTPARRTHEAVPDEEETADVLHGAAASRAAGDFESLFDDEANEKPSRSQPSWRAYESPMRPVAHEQPATPYSAPDSHSWRDQMGPPSLTGGKDEAEGKERLSWAKLTTKQKGGVIALAVLAVGLLFYLFSSGRISQNSLDKINAGMTETEVENILGPGEAVAESESSANAPQADKSIKMKKWESGNIIILIQFKDGTVFLKDLHHK